MAIIQPRPTHIIYQRAKLGDDRASFNIIMNECDVKHVKSIFRYFWRQKCVPCQSIVIFTIFESP